MYSNELVLKCIFFLLGIGVLLPWNAFISAKPYFQARFCNGQEEIVKFELWFGFIWNISSVVSLTLVLLYQYLHDQFFVDNTTTSSNDNEQQQQLTSSDYDSTTGSNGPTQRLLLSSSTSMNNGATTTNNTSNNNIDEYSSNQDIDTINESNNNNDNHSDNSHSFWLVMVPLSLFLTVFTFTDSLVLIQNVTPTNFLYLTFIGLSICGICCAIATAGIVSTAGFFPPNIGIGPFFSGQAMGGVVVSIANFMAATWEDPMPFVEQYCNIDNEDQNDNDELNNYVQSSCSPYHEIDWAVFLYFLLGCFVLLLCLMGYSYVDRYQKHNQHHPSMLGQLSSNSSASSSSSSPSLSYEPVQDVINHDHHDDGTSPRIGLQMIQHSRQEQQDDSSPNSSPRGSPRSYQGNVSPALLQRHAVDMNETIQCPDSTIESCANNNNDNNNDNHNLTMDTICLVKSPAFCIFGTFAITLCLFPGWVSELKSVHECENIHNRLQNDLYTPFAFVLFNIGDFMGRVVASKIVLWMKQFNNSISTNIQLVLACLSRIVLIPIFLTCVSSVDDNTSKNFFNNIIIPSDLYSWTVQFIFALSNGIIISASFMHAPTLLPPTASTEIQERSSEILTWCLSVGLLTGSLLSFPFAQLSGM